MIKTSKTINGSTVTRYTFTAKDKESLMGYLPVNPCISCPPQVRIACCGCPKNREYLNWMYSRFGDDPELIKIAESIALLRLKKQNIDKAYSEWEKECSKLPKQVREFTKL